MAAIPSLVAQLILPTAASSHVGEAPSSSDIMIARGCDFAWKGRCHRYEWAYPCGICIGSISVASSDMRRRSFNLRRHVANVLVDSLCHRGSHEGLCRNHPPVRKQRSPRLGTRPAGEEGHRLGNAMVLSFARLRFSCRANPMIPGVSHRKERFI